MARQTLSEKLESIRQKRDWTHTKLREQVGISHNLYAKFRRDPKGSSEATIEKVRAFVENPDRKRPPNGRKRSRRTAGKSAITPELLEFLSEVDGDDCIRVAEIMRTLGHESINLEQLNKLLELDQD